MMSARAIMLASLSLSGGCLAQSGAVASPPPMKVVVGSPFSAQAVTESTQVLADGNRIVKKTTAFIARDNEGRTRREQKLAGTDASMITIQDPVAGAAYMIDSRRSSVRKISTDKVENALSPLQLSSNEESLGTQMIDGFVAEGVRSIRTIPAGTAGNERAIEVITETWHSSQLQTILMRKTVDPRYGEVTYKLTNFELAEPARSLFEIPKNYTIDEPQRARSALDEN